MPKSLSNVHLTVGHKAKNSLAAVWQICGKLSESSQTLQKFSRQKWSSTRHMTVIADTAALQGISLIQNYDLASSTKHLSEVVYQIFSAMSEIYLWFQCLNVFTGIWLHHFYPPWGIKIKNQQRIHTLDHLKRWIACWEWIYCSKYFSFNQYIEILLWRYRGLHPIYIMRAILCWCGYIWTMFWLNVLPVVWILTKILWPRATSKGRKIVHIFRRRVLASWRKVFLSVCHDIDWVDLDRQITAPVLRIQCTSEWAWATFSCTHDEICCKEPCKCDQPLGL